MKKIWIIGFLSLFGQMAMAQNLPTAKDSIEQTIRQFFEGMKNADSAAMHATMADSAIFQTIAPLKTGGVAVRTENIAEFLKQVASMEKGKADERITFQSVLVDGALGSVWTPYQFYFGEKFSHCGVNSFQMVRIGNQWKIQYVIDTRRRKGCE